MAEIDFMAERPAAIRCLLDSQTYSSTTWLKRGDLSTRRPMSFFSVDKILSKYRQRYSVLTATTYENGER